MLRTLLLSLLLPALLADLADSVSACYGNCNSCSAADFTVCASSNGTVCSQGYYFLNNTCVLGSAFNVIPS